MSEKDLTTLRDFIVDVLKKSLEEGRILSWTVALPDEDDKGSGKHIEPFGVYLARCKIGGVCIDPVMFDGVPSLKVSDGTGVDSIFKLGKDFSGFPNARKCINDLYLK